MKKVCGLVLFCWGFGMGIMFFFPRNLLMAIWVVGFVVVGYNLFSCD